MANYYNLPFSFESLLKRRNRESYSCSLQESIRQNISLVISTKFNEFRYDPAYGCEIWEVDFIVPANMNIWKEEIKAALEAAILRYEYRIESIKEFSIDISNDPQRNRRQNQVLDFRIQGTIKGTSQEFEFADTLFFSPYSR